MVATRSPGLRVIEGSVTYDFPISKDGKGRAIAFDSHPWQPGDPKQPFRVRLFPFDKGISADRLYANPRTYAKANADTSFRNLLLHPPRLKSLTLTNGSNQAGSKLVEFNNDLYDVGGRYAYRIGLINSCTNGSFETDTTGWTTGGTNTIARSSDHAIYGSYSCKATYSNNLTLASYAVALGEAVRYLFKAHIFIPTSWDGGAITITATGFTAGTSAGATTTTTEGSWVSIEVYMTPDAGDLVGTLVISAASAPTAGQAIYINDVEIHILSEDKDFGAGNAAVDACTFNNVLVVAMGETINIWQRTTTTWSQSAGSVFAIALGVVDAKLCRVETNNEFSNCLTTPLTLTNWTPADPNEYLVGDTTYACNTIIDYMGGTWVGAQNGMFAVDPTYLFHNQTPQLYKYPHVDNCKGAFVAHGVLWTPSASGLIGIGLRPTVPRGPEKAGRPDYRFWVRGGVEWGGDIYLLCTDEQASENTVIIKMSRDLDDPSQYHYYEWCRLGATTKGYAITVTSKDSRPRLFVKLGADLRVIDLGRGGGRYIDDPNYSYGTAGVLETGKILPGPDMSVVHVLQGVETVLDYSATGESLTLDYRQDQGSYANLLTTQEGGGTAAISGTTNFQSVIRYAPSTAVGQFLEIRFTSTLVEATGTNRPEIIDAFAFGYLRPLVTDRLVVALVDDGRTVTGLGMGSGQSSMSMHTLFRNWFNSSTVLELQIADYEEGKTTRFLVTDVQQTEVESGIGIGPMSDPTKVLVVTMVRVPFGPDYAS